MKKRKIIFGIAIVIAMLMYSINLYAIMFTLEISGEKTVGIGKKTQLKAELVTSNDVYLHGVPGGGFGETGRRNVTNKATWKSSNPHIATVDDKGKVTGVAEGTTTITAKYEMGDGSCYITVKPTSESNNILTHNIIVIICIVGLGSITVFLYKKYNNKNLK